MLTDIEKLIRLLFLGLLAAELQGTTAASTEFKFILAPRNVYVVENRPFTWPCDITTSEQNGPVHFQWTKDGRNITGSDRRVVLLANGSLHFLQIVHRKRRGLSDEGHYRCLATNRLGSIISPRASLRVAVLPRIISPSGSSGITSPSLTEGAAPLAVRVTQAYLGDSVRLHCNITGSSPPPRVSWVKDESTLPPSRMGNKYFVLESGVLHIINLESSDAGDYQCLARNIADQWQSPSLRLQVTKSSTPRPPRIVSPHQNVTSLAGSDVTLQCLATGSPPPRTYWTRQNGAVLLENVRYRQLNDGSLYIAHIQHSDQGIYICHASGRPAFDNEATISAAVRVLVPPIIKMRPDMPSSTLFYGYPLNLQCRVMGQPVPRITWFKNGAPLHIHGRVKTHEHGSELEVGQCQPSDGGYYQCYAENEAGVVQSSTYVTIKKPPHHSDPPVNVTVVRYTNTTISVSWYSPPASPNFPIIAFSVHHFPVEDGQELQHVVDLKPQIEQDYTIEDLIPYTNYTIYLVAYTPQGASEHSTYLYQHTAEGVPAAGPPVALTPTSPSTMQVEWEALPPNLAGGRLKQYKLVYRSLGLASQYVLLPAQQHQHLLTSLMPGTKYYVRVEAATGVGYNLNPTEKTWPWTFANTPISIPVNSPAPPLTSLSANQTSISVVWEEPGEEEPIVEYRLICVDLSEQIEESKNLGASARTYVFTRLKSGTWYEITVSARNRFGYGREVSEQIQTLVTARDGSGSQPTIGPPIPLPPIAIEISPVTSSQVRITWSDLPTTQTIVRYSILYYMVEPQPTVQVQEHYRDSSSDTQVAILADLAPFTEYELAIQSHTQSAKSSYSKKRRFMTLEGVPSSPEDLTGAARRPGTVELHWRPPERTNGIIMSYIIMYNVDAQQNEDHWLKRTHNGSSTSAVIDDLEADKSYFFKLIATTKAGSGPPTPPLRVSALCAGPDCKAGPPLAPGVDRSVGIGIGVGIALGAVVLVVLIIFVKHRCSRFDPPPRTEPRDLNAIYRPTSVQNGTLVSRGVEIESYIPMLPALTENSASDSKGGVVQVRVKMPDCIPGRQDSQRIHLLTSSNATGDDPSKASSGRPVSLTIDNDHVANLVTNGNVPSSPAVAMETVHSSGSTHPTNHDRSVGPCRADDTIQVNRESVAIHQPSAASECQTASDWPSTDVSFSTSDLNGNPNNDALPSNDLDSRTDNQAQFLPPDYYLSVA